VYKHRDIVNYNNAKSPLTISMTFKDYKQ